MKFGRALSIITVFLVVLACKKNGTPESGGGGSDDPQPQPSDIVPDKGITLYGLVSDTGGNPMEGVVVSDGFTCVKTDTRGVYQIIRDKSSKFVFISTPSGYECMSQKDFGNMPFSYQASKSLTGSVSSIYRADFTLKKRSVSDSHFKLVAIGDPQPDYDSDVERFRNESVPDINKELKQYAGVPAVAVGLGDIIGNDENHSGKRLTKMKKALGELSIPVYCVNGNHDKDKLSVDGETFSNIMGPLNYSFNMGMVHFVMLDDLRFYGTGAGDYSYGFTKEQYDWLKQDLSFVPKTWKIVVCYHAALYDNFTGFPYATEILNLIAQYKEPVLMAAHSHNYKYCMNKLGMREYILSTVCGVFWRSNHACDGTPNGYYIFDFNGTEIKDMYFKATDWDKSHQMRIYRATSTYFIKGGGTYSFSYDGLGENEIAINVFSGGPDWTVNVYEDGVKTGTAEYWPNHYDRWICALFIHHCYGINMESDVSKNKHMFRYKLKNPSAKVTVEAADPYGNVFSETTFVESNDFSFAEPPYQKGLQNSPDRPYTYFWWR